MSDDYEIKWNEKMRVVARRVAHAAAPVLASFREGKGTVTSAQYDEFLSAMTSLDLMLVRGADIKRAWKDRSEWRCPVCRCGGVRGTEDLHLPTCHGLPHDPSCSAFFATDPLTGESICDCGRIVR